MTDETQTTDQTAGQGIPTPQEWAKQVAEHLGDAQRRWLELANEQSALMSKVVEEAISFYRAAPDASLAEWVRQGIENMTNTPKQWAEAAAEQRERFMQAIGGRSDGVSETAQRAMSGLQQPVEGLMDVRKRWLDFVANQNEQIVGAIQRGAGMPESSPVARLADLQKQSVNNYVEVQKRWLDVADQLLFPKRDSKNESGDK